MAGAAAAGLSGALPGIASSAAAGAANSGSGFGPGNFIIGALSLFKQHRELAQQNTQFQAQLGLDSQRFQFEKQAWEREWSAATTAGLYSPSQFGSTSSDAIVGKLKSNGRTLYQPRVPLNSFRNF